MKRVFSIALSTVAALIFFHSISPAYAEDYPSRAIRILVPYPPGGTTDLLARLVAPHLSSSWGVPVIVENRPGASGNIGMDVVAKSPPDGYTLAMTSNVVAINVALLENVPFKLMTDFEPLGIIGSTPMVLVVNPALPVASLADLTKYAKDNPGRLAYASCGTGTPFHLAVESYRASAQVQMLHVPYKGCTPGVTDLIAGHVQVMALTTAQAAPQISSGKMRALAVTTAHRSAILPDVPTVQEAGIPNYDFDLWYGLMAPAKMPAAIRKKVYETVRQFITTPAIARRLRESGVEELVTTPEEEAKILERNLERFARLVKELKLTQSN